MTNSLRSTAEKIRKPQTKDAQLARWRHFWKDCVADERFHLGEASLPLREAIESSTRGQVKTHAD